MRTVLRYVLITAMRDRLFIGMLAALILATGISATLAATSMLEVQEMTLAFSAAAARIILMLGLIVFVAFHVRQAFDTREIDVMLSRPISRSKLVFSHWMAFALVALVMTVIAALVIWFVSPLSMEGFLGWSLSLLLEAWLVVAFTLFASLILSSGAISVLVSAGFYVLSRMMGFFIASLEGRTIFESPEINMMTHKALEAISVMIPRLDFYAKSSWLSYGFDDAMHAMSLVAIQSAIFIPLLLTAAIIDFRRRQF